MPLSLSLSKHLYDRCTNMYDIYAITCSHSTQGGSSKPFDSEGVQVISKMIKARTWEAKGLKRAMVWLYNQGSAFSILHKALSLRVRHGDTVVLAIEKANDPIGQNPLGGLHRLH